MSLLAGERACRARCLLPWRSLLVRRSRRRRSLMCGRVLGAGLPGCWAVITLGRPRSRNNGWCRPANSLLARQVRSWSRSGDAQAERWAGRFADLPDEDPSIEAELRALVEEIAAQLPTAAVSAADHSVAAGQDVHITASDGGTAAGVIHGNVAPPNPTPPGPAQQ